MVLTLAMDTRTQNIINSNRQLIIDDLHSDVFEDLLANGGLSQEEHTEIMVLDDQETKNGKLLEILVNKNNGLEKLMEALKEWYWWIEKSLKESLEEQKLLWKINIAHTNIPPISNRNVSRLRLLGEVRTALKNLNNGHYVILHGMSGCGKSSLAAEALHDDILTTCFEGKVHWLKCGQEMDSEDEHHLILGLQIELNERICNEELVVSDVKTASVNILRTKLMKRLESSEFKKGLIVLDGVNSPHVLTALNIGCKTLVTTTDLNVCSNLGNRVSSIKVDEGFTQKESLELLAKCVDLPLEELPTQATQIHLHSKGHPLMMSLIGGQIEIHQEELKLHKEKWNPYVDVFRSKDYGNLKRRSMEGDSFSTKDKTIELCINSLSSEMKEKYQDFALFVEDVNIKTKVLEILWKIPEQEVREIMDDFYRKSLIVRKFNTTQNSYVYGIHDLLLYHIKKQLDEKKLQELHLKLIRCYEDYCNGDLSKLPRDDNYFFYYIGYHIANAKLYERLSQWYFDLDFIEGKLKAAGPGDLLLDYKRYSSHFIEDSNHDTSKMRSKLSDFERFVELSGYDVKRDNMLDIVQLALQEPHTSEVYRTAQRCVGSRKHKTYLHFQLGPSKSRSAPLNIPAKEKISCACFSKDSSDLIVAYESGSIQVRRLRRPFQCGICDKSFAWNKSLVRHMMIHSQQSYTCNVCGSVFKRVDILTRHMKTFHTTSSSSSAPQSTSMCRLFDVVTRNAFKEQILKGLIGQDNGPAPPPLQTVLNEPHHLQDVGRQGRRRCHKCYEDTVKAEDRQAAMRKTPQSKFKCSSCNHHFCLTCFFQVHNVSK